MANSLKNKTLSFNTVKVSSKLANGKTLYRANVVAGQPKNIEEIAQDLFEANGGIPTTTIKSVLNLLVDKLPGMIASDGCRRNLGDLVTFAPYIGGSFATPDAAFDKNANSVYIGASTPLQVRASLDGITVLNVTSGVKSSVISVADLATNTDKTVIGMKPFTVTGRNIYVFADRSDEGVWLVAADGSKIACAVDHETQDAITCAAASKPAAGDYTLKIVTRGGKDASLATIELGYAVKVLANTPAASLDSMVHVATNVRDEIHGTGAILLAGKNLMISAVHADEGVWIEKADGTKVCNMKVVENHLDTLTVQPETADLPAGDCYVVVATRGGGAPAEVDLATLKHAAKIIVD